MPLFTFFQEAQIQSQASTVFWCRGCTLLLSILLLLPIFGLVATALDSVTPWEQNQAWYVMDEHTENPFVCQKNSSCDSVVRGKWVASAEQGKCWKLFMEDPTTFLRAKGRCERENSTLAIVESEKQNEEVHQVCSHHQPCWIGLARQDGSTSEFQWIDDAALNYTRWHEDSSMDSADFAVMGWARNDFRSADGTMDDSMTNIFLMFINIVMMALLCGIVYKSMMDKSSSLLMCAMIGDTSCALCCCLWIFMLVSQIAGGDRTASTWVEMSLACAQVVALMVGNYLSLKVEHRMKKVYTPSQLPDMENSDVYQSHPSFQTGQVVVGKPVQPHNSASAADDGGADSPGASYCQAANSRGAETLPRIIIHHA